MRKASYLLKPVENRLRLDVPRKSGVGHLNIDSQQHKSIVDQKKVSIINSSTHHFQQTPENQPEIFLNTEAVEIKKHFRLQENNNKQNKAYLTLSSSKQSLSQGNTNNNKFRTSMRKSRSFFSLEKQKGAKEEEVKPAEITEIKIQKSSEIDQYIEDILNILQRNSELTVLSGLVSFQLKSLASLLRTIILQASTLQDNRIDQQLNELDTILSKIQRQFKESAHNLRQSKLGINSQMLSETIDPIQFADLFQRYTETISSLQQKTISLEEKVRALEQKQCYFQRLCKEKHNQMTEWERSSYQKKCFLESCSLQEETLKKKIEDGKKQLKRVQEEAEKIAKFVQTQQERPIMQYVAADFKRIQGEIFDYALYLQSNELFSSLSYEPKPFSVVEKYMEDDMKDLNSFLLYGSDTIEEKQKKMTHFVSECLRKFKLKDKEMGEVNRLKTECVLKFIEMMQTWVTNFDYKEETLVDLRKEFVVDSERITSLLQGLFERDDLSTEVTAALSDLRKHWNKVEENYKYGNYFY